MATKVLPSQRESGGVKGQVQNGPRALRPVLSALQLLGVRESGWEVMAMKRRWMTDLEKKEEGSGEGEECETEMV